MLNGLLVFTNRYLIYLYENNNSALCLLPQFKFSSLNQNIIDILSSILDVAQASICIILHPINQTTQQ